MGHAFAVGSSSRARSALGLLVLAGAQLLPVEVSASVEIVLRNVDAPGVGLNDESPTQPVGGNPGLTRGEQRRIAVQTAFDVWGEALDGAVPIHVDVSFGALPQCSAAGGAEPGEYVQGEPGLDPGLRYPVALAEQLAGRELNGEGADVSVVFNAAPCADDPPWYLGIDGQAPSGSVDLSMLALHELTHGLGFRSTVSPFSGELAQGALLDPYSWHIYDTAVGKAWREMTEPERAASVLRKRTLVFAGPHTVEAARAELALGSPSLTLAPSPQGFSGLIAEASVGPFLSNGLSARLRWPSPATGCSPLPNNGIESVVIVSPGECALSEKAQIAAAGGALALLVISEFADSPPHSVDAGGVAHLALPVLALTRGDAALLDPDVATVVTLGVDATKRTGTDAEGRPLLHVAEPIVQGSNLDHWDPLLRPSPLLEPSGVGDRAYLDVTLERAVLRDLGWQLAEDDGEPQAPLGSPEAGASPEAGTGFDAGFVAALDADAARPADAAPDAALLEAAAPEPPLPIHDAGSVALLGDAASCDACAASAEAGSQISPEASPRRSDGGTSGCACAMSERGLDAYAYALGCLLALAARRVRFARPQNASSRSPFGNLLLMRHSAKLRARDGAGG